MEIVFTNFYIAVLWLSPFGEIPQNYWMSCVFSFVDRMELLEIAKANAAKALGTAHLHLPASLRTVYVPKETNRSTALPNNGAKFEVSI